MILTSDSFVDSTRICEAIIRTIIFKIEREQTQESMKKRLKTSTTTTTTPASTAASTTPKPDHRKLALTRLLTERTDTLRQEFIGNRLNRKSVLVKEQVQTQRLKQQQQQQVILKQQQATIEKEEESSSDANNNKPNSPPPPLPAKKPRKSTGNETKKIPKTTSEPKAKRYLMNAHFSPIFSFFFFSTPSKRTRPLPPTKPVESDPSPAPKKARRESSDNDENAPTNSHQSTSSSTAKMKSTEKSKKIITIKNSSNKTEINLSDINCSCHRTDLPDKFFVQCELCSRWMHGTCVGLTPRLAQKMKEIICTDCKGLTEKAKERLYCLCQTPYDESE